MCRRARCTTHTPEDPSTQGCRGEQTALRRKFQGRAAATCGPAYFRASRVDRGAKGISCSRSRPASCRHHRPGAEPGKSTALSLISASCRRRRAVRPFDGKPGHRGGQSRKVGYMLPAGLNVECANEELRETRCSAPRSRAWTCEGCAPRAATQCHRYGLRKTSCTIGRVSVRRTCERSRSRASSSPYDRSCCSRSRSRRSPFEAEPGARSPTR